MSQDERKLPPGPNPREDQMTEKDQRQLREHLRQSGHKTAGSDWEGPNQTEGERSNVPSRKVGHTPDQAEGDRDTIEKELEEKKRH